MKRKHWWIIVDKETGRLVPRGQPVIGTRKWARVVLKMYYNTKQYKVIKVVEEKGNE